MKSGGENKDWHSLKMMSSDNKRDTISYEYVDAESTSLKIEPEALFCNYFFFHSVFVFHYIIIEEKITYTEKWVAAFFSVTKTAKSLSLSFAHNYEPYYIYMHVCNPPLTEISYSSGSISGNIQFSRFSPAAACCWMTDAPRICSVVDACYLDSADYWYLRLSHRN